MPLEEQGVAPLSGANGPSVVFATPLAPADITESLRPVQGEACGVLGKTALEGPNSRVFSDGHHGRQRLPSNTGALGGWIDVNGVLDDPGKPRAWKRGRRRPSRGSPCQI